MRLLLAEDDRAVLDILVRGLEEEGYVLDAVERGDDALHMLRLYDYSAAIIDWRMPGLSGDEVVRQARKLNITTPMLMLTARDAVGDKVVGLDAGADDYVTKPFRLAELLARVRALLRRGAAEPAQPPATHGVRIDVESHRAWMGEEELQLTAKEFDLLRVLVRDAGRVVTRDQLMREVWDTTWWSSTKTLDMHISWLRKKLGDDAANPRYIATVRGVGFRFEKS